MSKIFLIANGQYAVTFFLIVYKWTIYNAIFAENKLKTCLI